MKKLIITSVAILALLLSLPTQAQDFFGTVTYETKLSIPDFDIPEDQAQKIPEDMQALIKEQLEAVGQNTYILNFNKTESLYEKKETPKSVDLNSSIIIQTEGGEQVNYTNLKEGISIAQVDLYDKLFLITDSVNNYKWKITQETKKIGDYAAYKATYILKGEEAKTACNQTPKDREITAWYTPQIPVQFGPANYGGLPGLILELNDGAQTILCSQIVLNPKKRPEIKAPKKGKKVTAKEFEKISEQKMKEIQEDMKRKYPNGNGSFQIEVIGN